MITFNTCGVLWILQSKIDSIIIIQKCVNIEFKKNMGQVGTLNIFTQLQTVTCTYNIINFMKCH